MPKVLQRWLHPHQPQPGLHPGLTGQRRGLSGSLRSARWWTTETQAERLVRRACSRCTRMSYRRTTRLRLRMGRSGTRRNRGWPPATRPPHPPHPLHPPLPLLPSRKRISQHPRSHLQLLPLPLPRRRGLLQRLLRWRRPEALTSSHLLALRPQLRRSSNPRKRRQQLLHLQR